MRKFIAQKFGNQLYDLLNKRSLTEYYKIFKPLVNADRKTIEDFQFNRLRLLLEHAYNNVPFYRDRFNDLGLVPGDIRTMKDFAAFPSLTREDLQNHWKKIKATNFNNLQLSKGSSSGSTGVPVVYFKDPNASSAGKAAHQIGWELSGWEFGLKGLHIWGNPTTVNKEWKRLSSKLKTRIYNQYKYPAYQLTEKGKFDELVAYINKMKFDFIDGYTNAIYLLADYVKQNNIKIHKPKYVLPTGENLQGFQKKLMEEVLGKVYDEYGCSEINGIAYECEECGKYHVLEPHVIVEYGKRIAEEEQALIITDLDNYGFPLIRYENGDAGIPVVEDEIDCKIQFQRMEMISGRVSDIIHFPNGGVLSVPSFFGSMLLKKITGIKQYQIERIEENQLVVKLVVGAEFSTADRKLIEHSLKDYLGDSIQWEIIIVDNIEVSKTGKFKLLIDKTKRQC
jgi:phenylacetate-CoA ligase